MRFEPSKGKVGRDLEENIRNEEDSKSDVILIPFQMQVFFEIRQTRLADVDLHTE